MRKKTFPFYDLLIYAIICGPLIVVALYLLCLLVENGIKEWIWSHLHILFAFAFSVAVSIAGPKMFRWYELEGDELYFHYFTFAASWKKATTNIDIRWNQFILVSEVESVEIVKLTKEEKRTKVFYRHWFNKYLKINLKYGSAKYVYVGNYANFQIKKIVTMLTAKSSNK